jgi:hypothetical protein
MLPLADIQPSFILGGGMPITSSRGYQDQVRSRVEGGTEVFIPFNPLVWGTLRATGFLPAALFIAYWSSAARRLTC